MIPFPIDKLYELVQEWKKAAAYDKKENPANCDAGIAYSFCADKLEYILRSFDEDVKQENKELHESFSKWCQERGQFP